MHILSACIYCCCVLHVQQTVINRLFYYRDMFFGLPYSPHLKSQGEPHAYMNRKSLVRLKDCCSQAQTIRPERAGAGLQGGMGKNPSGKLWQAHRD